MKHLFYILIALFLVGCSSSKNPQLIQDVSGVHKATPNQIWLSHEHILVDFIGADSIQPASWDHEAIIKETEPYLLALKEHGVTYFVDATPNYLGRDVLLLQKLSKKTGLKILTNTGLYGAGNDKFIPQYAKEVSAEKLAMDWISEFEQGIDGTPIKPGFIKIGIDAKDTLSVMHQKLVKAAAITHLKTGLTIASHTGEAAGLWPQLAILKEMGVSPQAFIWVHAQNENDNENYRKASQTGCWISLDGLGWELDNHLDKIMYAKTHGFLDQILISHDAGWYDPQKETQNIQPYTTIFTTIYPELKARGFTDDEFHMLISINPSKAYALEIKNDSSTGNDN
ncbi:MAG: phosphotriesterase [Maribacter sp.]|nr:phosphotriesterase [Maribacter sp.]